jgi:hypothetical protein
LNYFSLNPASPAGCISCGNLKEAPKSGGLTLQTASMAVTGFNGNIKEMC